MDKVAGDPITANEWNWRLTPPGVVLPFAGRATSIPTSWILCDGNAISRTTYADLFSVLNPSFGTVIITIATPAVITNNSHGLKAGSKVFFTTTGALPTGISANTVYHVISTGLTTNTFQIATTPNGTAINTSGTQSGTHTLRETPFGIGDGSTTFNVPNMQSRIPVGAGVTTKVATFVSRSSNTITVFGLSDTSNNEFQTGQAVVYATSGSAISGLTNGTTYYIIKSTNKSFSLATSLANAVAGSAISLASDGSGTQTFTLTFSTKPMGETGGEETHGLTKDEMPAHSHQLPFTLYASGGYASSAHNTQWSNGTPHDYVSSVGGDIAHNNMQPFVTMNYIIKA